MIKKLLSLVLIMSVLVGVCGVLGDTATVTVGETNITLDISPSLIEFGPQLPGVTDVSAISSNVTISANTYGNNMNIYVDVTVSGEPFESNLKFNSDIANGMSTIDLLCDDFTGVCMYTDVVLIPTLTIPIGTPAGEQIGTVTYTITGSAP